MSIYASVWMRAERDYASLDANRRVINPADKSEPIDWPGPSAYEWEMIRGERPIPGTM